MNPKCQLIFLAAFAAAVLPLPRVLADTTVPQITMPADALPAVTFSIPRYQLTALERETVAACLVLEAASQGTAGMRGVMAVIRNRAGGRPELFSPTVLRQKQFSALNRVTSGRESLGHAIERARKDRTWSRALQLVDESLSDTWHDPTLGATHYTRSVETTRWTRSLAKTVTIGAHSFYR
jgi:hypothetical protein